MPDLHDDHATIRWYRTPLPREELIALNATSDLKGFLQAGGYFGLLVCMGAATLWSAFAGYWYLTLPLLLLHGTAGHFHINGVHELCHNTVFKTKWLSNLFIHILGFTGWSDWVWFNASHANHHRYTLHPPRDGEVVLPVTNLSRKAFWKGAIWYPRGPYDLFKGVLRKVRGQAFEDEWTRDLFPENKPEARRKLVRWNLLLLVGHGGILTGSVLAAVLTQRWAWLLVPYVVSFSGTYGGWLFFLCNNTQHVGLTDKVPDFRLCCRSMKLPWIVSFLYWHMQYHTEHHMYAAVPCYNLHRLHKRIAHDLPEPKGLVGAWKEIGMILKRQETEPDYQHVYTLPDTAHPPHVGDREQESG